MKKAFRSQELIKNFLGQKAFSAYCEGGKRFKLNKEGLRAILLLNNNERKVTEHETL